jgi:hypothetical protein
MAAELPATPQQDAAFAETTFPCECPSCQAPTGFPYRVTTDASRLDCVHVHLRCRSCSHEWHFERASTLSPRRRAAV